MSDSSKVPMTVSGQGACSPPPEKDKKENK